jgi:hypothetical protein
MRKVYSSKSLALPRFPLCFETISKLIKYTKMEISKGYTGEPSDAVSIESLKDLHTSEFPIKIRFLKDNAYRSVHFSIHTTYFFVDTYDFEKAPSDEIHRIIQETLGLAEPTEEDKRGFFSLPAINDLLWKVYDRVEEISKRLDIGQEKAPDQMRCFVSFRFDDHNKALAFELREFMELAGLDFVSGLGFEPRSISEKVLERLSGPLHIFVIIFSSSGDSSWLNQEIGAARTRGLPILVLKEEGSAANAGMLVDTEYLVFPKDNISKAFVGILQALSYLRKTGKS